MIVEVVYQSVVGGFVGWLMYRWGFKKGWRACNEVLLEEHRKRDAGVVVPKLTTEQQDQILAAFKQRELDQPYRAKLEVVQDEPKKVYCKDCKHMDYEFPALREDPLCLLGEWSEDPVKGRYRKTRCVRTANANFNCKDFEKKP